MSRLDPRHLFARLARDIPGEIRRDVFVAGSLAAAYCFSAALEGGGLNTKDADLVVHPAGNANSARGMALRLLGDGWRRHPDCRPRARPEPTESLWAIRLYPPDSLDYFVELLNLPEPGQTAAKTWVPVELDDGWYGLPSFRFLGMAAQYRLASAEGMEYAAPEMMAISNLLAHPAVGPDRMNSEGPMKGFLRSAKDLGRVLALAELAGRDETEAWSRKWRDALAFCFPHQWRHFAETAGTGLKELLADAGAFKEAAQTTRLSLLAGRNITDEALHAVGRRLLVDALDPLAALAAAEGA